MDEAIKIEGVSVSYQHKRVLSNVYLPVRAGAVTGILGPNGAGKSTLFKAVLGLIPYLGKISIHGKPIEQCRKQVAYVPQKNEVDWQFPATVLDIVLMGRYPFVGILQKLSEKDKSIAKDALREVGMLEYSDRQIGTLSGGQQQRVFVARALCQQADVFFLDEPFAGVDMVTEQQIIQILQKLASQHKTILVIHHDLSSARDYFDELVLLNQRLIAYGPTGSVFTEKNIKATFGGQLPILHKVDHLR